MGVNTFPTTNHFLVLREERRNGQKIWGDVNDNKLKGIFDDPKAPDRRPILRKKNTDSWHSIQVTTVMCTVLVDTEFCEFFVRTL